MKPNLIKIDLEKTNKGFHPDLKLPNTIYLAKIKGYGWVTGHFSKCWHGLTFHHGWTMSQLDDGKRFISLYEINTNKDSESLNYEKWTEE